MNKEKFNKGLVTDTNYINQPKNSYTFALNAVLESDSGDILDLSNELSNKDCIQLENKEKVIGYIPMANNEIAVFSVDDSGISRIFIVKNCKIERFVETKDLNFNVDFKITGVFRYKEGCGRVIYFTDNKNEPRIFNFDKIDNFKTNNEWDKLKFRLIKSTNVFPKFSDISVTENGSLKAGSYNVAIQYLDEDNNPTPWLTISDTVLIYNDSYSNKNYSAINGSINGEADINSTALKYPKTSKSIRVKVDNIDNTYSFYRLAFIEATSGNGKVSSVKISDRIPNSVNVFNYTGNNAVAKISVEELALFNNLIRTAETITQKNNSLLLGNITGSKHNYCQLQKFASKIGVDAVTKKVPIQVKTVDGVKSPIVHTSGGYSFMPGEIYSFGIVYVFDNGEESPVFHIPGKNPNIQEDITYTSGAIPMSPKDNYSKNQYYIDNNKCNIDYWGKDINNNILKNSNVRHHRFPDRASTELPLIEKIGSEDYDGDKIFRIRLNFWGTVPAGKCTYDMRDGSLFNNGCPDRPNIKIKLTYKVGNVQREELLEIDPNTFAKLAADREHCVVTIPKEFPPHPTRGVCSSQEDNENKGVYTNAISTNETIELISIEEKDSSGNWVQITEGENYSSPYGLHYESIIEDLTYSEKNFIYVANVFGVRFSNIELPFKAITGENRVIGYRIVMQERTEDEKTILDSAVLINNKIYNNFDTHSLLGNYDMSISKKRFSFINPEFKFRDKQYQNFYFNLQGKYNIEEELKCYFKREDVQEGSSYDEDVHEDYEKDKDGWSLHAITNNIVVKYTQFSKKIIKNNIVNTWYLSALEKTLSKNNKVVYNVSGDNRIGTVEFSVEQDIENFSYAYLQRDLEDYYYNFKTDKYFALHPHVETTNTFESYAGDIYISSMRYFNSLFYKNHIRERDEHKPAWWEYVLAAVAIVAGVILTVTGIGAAAGAALLVGAGTLLTGAGLLYLSSSIKQENLIEAYTVDYKKGLIHTIEADWVTNEFTSNPKDDTIQWVGEAISDLWFESQVNIGLRLRLLDDYSTFLDSPDSIESCTQSVFPNDGRLIRNSFTDRFDLNSWYSPKDKINQHFFNKLLVLDKDWDSHYKYRGHVLGEGYFINEDLHRRNREKYYIQLSPLYDCCSSCQEKFPKRFTWSQQSFNEERTDNFRIFLPNNYKTVDSDIKKIESFFDTLYIFTDKSVLIYPTRYQERVANDIVTLIGTGEEYSLDPKTILKNGITNKDAILKTDDFIFMVSEKDGKLFKISKNNIELLNNKGINRKLKRILPINSLFNRHNSSSDIGTGYTAIYDYNYDRYILSKKDIKLIASDLNSPVSSSDLVIKCGKEYKVFRNYKKIIKDFNISGWKYVGIDDCKMRFVNTFIYSAEKNIIKHIKYNKDVDVVIHLPSYWDDSTIYFSGKTFLQHNIDVITETMQKYKDSGDFNGEIYYYRNTDNIGADRTFLLLKYIEENSGNFYDKNGNSITPTFRNDLLLLSFIGRTTAYYNNSLTSDIEYPTQELLDDIADYKNRYNIRNNAGDITNFILIPFVGNVVIDSNGNYVGLTQSEQGFKYLQTLYGVVGVKNNYIDITFIQHAPQLQQYYLYNQSIAQTQGVPAGYPQDSLKNYKVSQFYYNPSLLLHDKFYVFSDQKIEIKQYLILKGHDYEKIQINSPNILQTSRTENGEIVKLEAINNSFTLSYNNKFNLFVSFHSYLPNNFIGSKKEFYSTINNDALYVHNYKYSYQEYYNTIYPHIVEFVTSRRDNRTVFTENLRFYTEAFRIYKDDYVKDNSITFSEFIAYNSKQSTGLKTLKLKDTFNKKDYLSNQVKKQNEVLVDIKEDEYRINNLRDYVTNPNVAIFSSSIEDLQEQYFIDKIVNDLAFSGNKKWFNYGKLKDKYLVLRLIFNNFAKNVKLLTHLTSSQEYLSDEY